MPTKKIKIKQLREKYGMSQADLAKRMGISRPTLIKIEKGGRVLNMEEKSRVSEIFDLVLDQGSMRESDIRISIPQKNIEKFKQVLLYILGKAGGKPNVGMTVLYKLLYFIDFDYFEKYENQLMGLTYMKNRHGPTPIEFVKVVEEMKVDGDMEEVKSKYFTYEQRKFLPHKRADLKKLSGQELEVIDGVLARLSDKTAKELTDYSHTDVPWIVHDQGETISYESVFYRDHEHSVRNYDDEI